MLPPPGRATGLLLLIGAVAAAVPSLSAQAPERVVEVLVTGPAGMPLAGAAVRVRDEATGYARQRIADDAGRARLVVVDPGPFTVEAGAIGFRPARAAGVRVALGARVTIRLSLLPEEATTLPELTAEVQRPADPGPAYAISGTAVRGLPLQNRDVVGLFATVPQALGRDRYSISGQPAGLNGISIDGGIGNDVFGVGRTPGAVAGAKPVSLDAVGELRVLIAPLDVRQGGFSGGMIQAQTASGTNALEGSAFLSVRRPWLTGDDYQGNPSTDFSFTQYGLRLGGPIVRDRLHFFVVADLQSSTTEYAGPVAGEAGTGVSVTTADRIREVARTRYGFDPGGAEAPALSQPDQSVLAKLTWSPGRHRLDLSAQWVRADGDLFDRVNRFRSNAGGWQLAKSGATQSADVLALRFRAATGSDRLRHELLAGFQTIAESRASALRVPLFLVQADVSGTYVAAGSVKNAQGTGLDQEMLELTWNTTWTAGRHEVTGGLHAARFGFTDALVLGRWGVWTFPNATAFELGAATRYEVALPWHSGDELPVADFGAWEVAGYVQDRMSLSSRLSLTAGLRVESSLVEAPPTNPSLAANDALDNLNTGTVPGGPAVLSPRVGVEWLADARGRTTVRAGIGGFLSRPPYAWTANAHVATGQELRVLVCNPVTGVPAPVTDIANLPSECRSGTPPVAPPTITSFAPGMRFPQSVKLLAGIDHAFGKGFLGALDVVQTWTRNSYTMVDANLVRQGTNGEGRAMYGSIATFGVPRPVRRDPGYGPVYQYRNHTTDVATAVTVTLAKEWAGGAFVQAGYQWSRARDAFTMNAFTGQLNFQNMPVDGAIESRRLTRSGLDVPHSLTVTALAPLVLGLRGSVAVRAQSGRPYAYVALDDANADSTTLNDLVYVPRDSSDLTLSNPVAWGALDDFIRSERCLREQRGRIMARNSCRNPAFVTADARLARRFSLRSAGNLEATIDVFNFLNLIDSDWGLVKEASDREQRGLLRVDGWDVRYNRPIYGVPVVSGTGEPALPAPAQPVADISRWRIQLGLRWGW